MYTIIHISDSHKHFSGIIQEYEKRLSNKLQLIQIKPEKGDNVQKIKEKETQKIIQKIQGSKMYTVLMDETGKQYTSVDFEKHIHGKLHEHPRICFIIGGAYGVDKNLIQNHIDQKMQLSDMTFPHGFALAILMEQVYRATTIQKGTSYHHE